MIYLKTDEEIEKIRKSGTLAANTLRIIEPYIKPGITTLELNQICHNYIVEHGAIPAPLNYRGFPKSICTSINEVICHGIPSAREKLKEGDIINIDVTTILDGYFGDCSKTFFVGQCSSRAHDLVETTKRCMYLGIDAVKVGGHLGDIGEAIQTYARSKSYSVVIDFVGHGIGTHFHEDPQVFHVGIRGRGEKLVPGMVFTIEPMINEGTHKMKVLSNGWTAVTRDKKLSAQFEHTIGIKSDGSVCILTEPDI